MSFRAVLQVSAVAVVASGCAPKEVPYVLSIVTSGCAGANPFQGVQVIGIRVKGPEDGGVVTLAETVTPAGTGTATLPEIPAGPGRVIEVRAYDGDPAMNARVVSFGKTLPFDVPFEVPAMLEETVLQKRVFLRQVGQFSAPVSAASPAQCSGLKVARAGHTATLLENGKVFIAGGFNYPAGNPNRVALSAAEVFDPALGTFEAVRDISITQGMVETKFQKAFHTATRIGNGQVVLWGGELYTPLSGMNVVSPRSEVILYDADQNKYGSIPRQNPAPIPRTRHRAAVDVNGKLLIVGGLRFNTSGTGERLVPVNEVEWFDPDKTPLQPQVISGLALPKVDAALAPVKQGEFIAVAGGTNGTALQDDVKFFRWSGTAYELRALPAPPVLKAPGRRSSAGVSFRNGSDLLLLGGYDDAAAVKPVLSSEVVSPSVKDVATGAGIGPRGDVCAVTLVDGSVIAIGGRTVDATTTMTRSDPSTSLVTPDDRGGFTARQVMPTLPLGRYLHTCTLLADGSVLVTGGLNETAAKPEGDVLNDAWIYTPPPGD